MKKQRIFTKKHFAPLLILVAAFLLLAAPKVNVSAASKKPGAVGEVTNMYEIAEKMTQASLIVSPWYEKKNKAAGDHVFHHDSGDGDGKEGTGNGDFRAADPASIRDFSRVRTFLENETGNYAVLCVTNDTAAAEKVLKEAGF